jgi:hypothetical protein
MTCDHWTRRYIAQLVLLICVSWARTAFGDDEPRRATAFVLQWGKKGSGPGQFNFPIGIAINSSDEVFVTDFYNARVQKFSDQGVLVAVYSSRFVGIAM